MSSLVGVIDLASVLLQCFALILIGYISGRLELIPVSDTGLSSFVSCYALPALIFQSLATSDLSHIDWNFVVSLLISKTIIFLSVVIITAILTKPTNLGKSGLFGIFCTQSNDFALGYPLLTSLYAKSNPQFAGYLYVLAPIQLVLLNPMGLLLIETDKQCRRQRLQLNNCSVILLKVLKQIIKNPIIVMTVLGILWNRMFNHTIPELLVPLLQVLSNSFSATALFLLGSQLVGKLKIFTTSSYILLVSLVLVMTKILILPLLNRVIIQNLMDSQNNQTLELSNFGFLYGTFPSAPTAFIFALQYDSGIPSTILSTGMVMSTVLSAPLMFVSANMIRMSANESLPFSAFHSDLGQTMSYSGLMSVFCVLWTLSVLLCGHKWRSLTHKCTIALGVSQLMAGMGGYLWQFMDSSASLKGYYLIHHLQYREHMEEANEMTPLIGGDTNGHHMNECVSDFHQLSQHMFLLLTLLPSMLIGLTVSIGKLVTERPTGIFIELEFLDILLNYGQGVITFLIFGLDMTPVFYRIRNLYSGRHDNPCIVLPPLEALRPATKEILETVCEKQKLDSKDYELSRNNKPVDLSLTIRFANIPNNGQLDLRVSTVQRCDEKVTIAIDLETGERKIEEFESNDNLWHIIHKVFEGNPILNVDTNMDLCVIYMRKEILGETELKKTNLKGLGLFRGKAVMRLVVRAVESPKENPFVESLILRKPDALSKRLSNCETNSTPQQMIAASMPPPQSSSHSPPEQHIEPEQEIIYDRKVSENKYSLANETKGIEEDNCQQMEAESEESCDEGPEILNYLGDNNEGIFISISDLPKVMKIDYPDNFYETTQDDLVTVLKGLRQQQGERMMETKQMREQRKRNEMLRYKSTVVRICFGNDKLIFQAIFKPTDTVDTVMRTVSSYVIPNQFYLYTTPPKHELNAGSTLFDSNLVPAAVVQFGSKSCKPEDKMIRHEFLDKISSYKSAAKIALNSRKPVKASGADVRGSSQEKPQLSGPKVPKCSDVKSPGLIFQAIFKPTDTVDTVMRTVSSYVIPNQFYLYTTPPKHELNAESTLFDSNLVPAAVVQFGSKSCKPDDKMIRHEFLDKISSYKSAAKIALNSRKPVKASDADVSGSSQEKPQLSGPKDPKVPKWFKTNK
ncbi:unnamed protein product [Oppiella nova]|uniref:TUG ubiquitin-like domain-containing protein n=1 Tax=Oppiella nova TaxID=334625 RepID=A0A7R9QN95_9ACAR|nr:unnamed protein product [Oppiella nova]CAG2169311.1 unnamed protein product [Oppiella nova]